MKVMKTRQRVPYLLLRGTTIALAVLAVAQAALAGSFLSGHYPVLHWHLVTGVAMVAVALLQAVAVLLPGRRERPRSVLVAGLVLPVVIAGQGALGMNRVLGLHVPLGVLLVVGTMRIATWVWTKPAEDRTNPPEDRTKPPEDRKAAQETAPAQDKALA